MADMGLERVVALAGRLGGRGRRRRLLDLAVSAGPGVSVPAGPSPAGSADGLLRQMLPMFESGDVWLLAHDAELVDAALRTVEMAGVSVCWVDLASLARLCLPSDSCVDLRHLCGLAGTAPPLDGDLAAEAEAVRDVGLWLGSALRAWSAARVALVLRALGNGRGPSVPRLLRAVASARGLRAAARDDCDELLQQLVTERPPVPRASRTAGDDVSELNIDDVAAVFERGGAFDSVVEHYEYRSEQVAMTRAVMDAYNRSRHLLVEAGTGVGKSLAYLVPSVLWALINGTAVVVSTNTKNLQQQLYSKDLPLISRVLSTPFRTALIKGRRNYICLRRLAHLLRYADVDVGPDERVCLASVVGWVSTTATGDVAEWCFAGVRQAAEFTSGLSSDADECAGRACRWRRRCFLQYARRRSLAADIVVANHSVVFAEMAMPNSSPVLPPYAHVVFDEAHNLEGAITAAMTREVSIRRLRFVIGRLRREQGRGRRRGVRGALPVLTRLLKRGQGVRQTDRDVLLALVGDASHAVAAVDAAMPRFFEELTRFLPDDLNISQVRLRDGHRRLPVWASVMAARMALASALQGVSQALGLVRELTAETLGAEELPEDIREACHDVLSAAAPVRQLRDDLGTVFDLDDPTAVRWLARVPPMHGGAMACQAPVQVAGLLEELLYGAKDTVVLTSATLTVAGSAAFVKSRLGADRPGVEHLDEVIIGTPFDYARQCRILVPAFLPEPGEKRRDYTTELAQMLVELFRHTEGRALALFTSYTMLTECARFLIPELAEDGIRVLAQGISGSRDSITSSFKQDVRSVLLGTHSFWEGVDVAGESLSCLVLARLPFPVYTDPVVEARCEAIEAEGGSGFSGYSLPTAVIRFRQGFGRLIRHCSDRGVVVVADRRIVRRYYGQRFRDSLPTAVHTCPDRTRFLDLVAGFLQGR